MLDYLPLLGGLIMAGYLAAKLRPWGRRHPRTRRRQPYAWLWNATGVVVIVALLLAWTIGGPLFAGWLHDTTPSPHQVREARVLLTIFSLLLPAIPLGVLCLRAFWELHANETAEQRHARRQ